ncbi:hypothetical protein WMY93_030394 [Mugilogobius chulae]|uniref:Endonuclease/exonuclease/phosphatase domain-containing protein n=1 Tax=Mugilogobius chulae TaxID=88201 RepID=A0AAW0MEM3_9GOBI
MDAVAPGKAHLSGLNFEEKSLIRAEQHELLRGKNNTTSCRSPTREFDTKSIKNELREKRQLEFLKRRSVSPEMCGSKSAERHSEKRRALKLRRNIEQPNSNGRPVIRLERSLSESPTSSQWTSLWPEPTQHQASTSKTQGKSTENAVQVRATRVRTIRSEKVQLKLTQQSEFIQVKKMPVTEASAQTECGYVTVKETDLQKLADYLQEALWREQILKKKLASLQESTTNLMNSSDKIWTTRCSEDLLRNKIQALEAQLHVCLQKFPKDAVKKLLLQMERQKLVYEDKAVIALQKATEEKSEAVTKADTLQEALNTAQTEARRWQRLYEELKLNSEQLTHTHNQSNDQLLQLQHQVELSRVRETELKEELASLKQHSQELQYNICLLEEDNDVLREEIQNIRDGSGETEDALMQQILMPIETEQRLKETRSSEVEEQLQLTLEKLKLKEKECEELQTELSVMEQECQSTQARLSQCRDQLREISQRPRTATGGCSCLGWCLTLLLLLVLAVVGVLLWLWYPPFREQLQDLYSDIETRIEDYLIEMSSPRHSGCFRPTQPCCLFLLCISISRPRPTFTWSLPENSIDIQSDANIFTFGQSQTKRAAESTCEMRTLVLLVLGLCLCNSALCLKICAFNVQSFGEAKVHNKKVMSILLKILSRCDLSLIQEVRDSKGEAIRALVKSLNQYDKSNSYSYLQSERLGRKTYKEQYVYIYRDNVLKLKDHYQYPKQEREGTNETEVFSREPFIARFHSPTTLMKDLILIGQHTCPKNAMKEIDELYTVFKGIYKKWKTDNVMILGDLNAACHYVTQKGWRSVRLRGDPRFQWLIGDEQDTTVREKTHCAYDRSVRDIKTQALTRQALFIYWLTAGV